MPPHMAFHGVSTKKAKSYQGEYGTPAAGTLTEMRARLASKHVGAEIVKLLTVIEQLGGCDDRDDADLDDEEADHAAAAPREVSFGDLFEAYTAISDKLVGMLLRARRHGCVDFPGEMLFQGMHDGVVIVPKVRSRDLQDRMDYGAGPEWGSSISAAAAPAPAAALDLGTSQQTLVQWRESRREQGLTGPS